MTLSEVEAAETPASPDPDGQNEAPPPPETAAATPPPSPPTPAAQHPVLVGVGISVTLAALLMLGFAVYLYGLSGLSEARAQTNLYKTLSAQLSLAIAPVGPASEGAPVAILNIPALGISDMVVVEGTTSGDLMHGPGHVQSSVLPGEAGVSVIYGRVATFGAPFAHLLQLNRGDEIKVTTGLGVSTYQVESFGSADKPAPDPTADRLILETADSTIYPGGTFMVSADLRSAEQPNPGGWPSITPQDYYLAGDPSALIPLVLWSQALLLASVGTVLAANRWSRWATYLCAVPVLFALVWSVYENLAALLPNLY